MGTAQIRINFEFIFCHLITLQSTQKFEFLTVRIMYCVLS